MNNNITKVELVLRKINYLFESLDPNQVNPSSLEIALLKRYAVDLYDNILQYEESYDPSLEKPFDFFKEQDAEESQSGFANNNLNIENFSTNHHDVADIKDEVTEDLTNILEEVKRKNNFDEQPISGFANIKQEETIQEELVQEEEILEHGNESLNTFEWELPKEEIVEKESIIEKTETSYFDRPEVDSTAEIEKPSIIEEPSLIVNKLENNFPEVPQEKKEVIPPPKVFDILEENISNPKPVEKPAVNNNFVDTAKTDVLTNIAYKLKRDQDRIIVNEKPQTQSTLNDRIVNNNSKQEEPKNLIDKLRTVSNSRKNFNISYNQRFAFVQDLFNGDGSIYEGTLNELGKCKNVIEAFTYLNLHVKMKYNWKDENPVVKEFQQVVKDFFLND